MGKYLLGLDEGTTGCKAVIFDFEGNIMGSDYREYPCYYPNPGWVEQTAEDITPALYATVKAAIANSGVDPKEIVAMAISSQGSTSGFLDKDGNDLYPFLGWQDLRGTPYIEKLKEIIPPEEYYSISGWPYSPIPNLTKYFWMRDQEPEVWEKTAILSQNQDYFLRVFGAKDGYWADVSTTSRTGLFDVDNFVWSDRILEAFDIPKEKLPVVAEGGQVVGKIPSDIAEKTGLAEGTLICVGAHDQNCSTFGGGLVEGGTAVMVMGTFGSCFVGMDKPFRDPKGKLVVKGNVGPNNWTMEGFSNTAAASYRWYRDTFGGLEIAAAKLLKKDPYELINEQIASIPPGANGITFLSCLQSLSGRRDDPYARGAFLGMSLGTTKADMARAVMEGITNEMRDIVEAQREAGIKHKAIRLTGGATKSRMWNQMIADSFKVPVQILQTSETGCLGAALYAGVGAGVYSSYKEAVETAVKIKEEYEPNPANFAAYDESYERWVKAYESLAQGGYFRMLFK